MRTVLQLVKELCSNFELTGPWSKKNYCNFEKEETDMQCGYFIDDIKDTYQCKYFEKAVLPIDKQVEALYYANLSAKTDNRELTIKEKKEIIEKNNDVKQCLKCNREFKSSNNRQIYCNKCKDVMRKDKTRIRNLNYRKNKLKNSEVE